MQVINSKKDMDMKKKYMKPSIVVEKCALPVLMQDVSIGKVGFGGGNGNLNDGDDEFSVDSKIMFYDDFGTFGSFDDHEY